MTAFIAVLYSQSIAFCQLCEASANWCWI